MDADQIRQLEPKLGQFLQRFADCFGRKDTRAHLGVYIRGQLSDLPQKSVEPIALEAHVPPRTLQEFLSQHRWDQEGLRDRLLHVVKTDHAGVHSIGIFDETADPKKGDKTPGVQRQWCGRLGKKENCVVTVHLAYAIDDFHCLLDGDLYLPESWAKNRRRRREAGIPKDLQFRPKWRIALDLYERACQKGLRFDWLTFDEGYGNTPELLRALTARQQRYMAEVPRNFLGWLKAPRVVRRRYHRCGWNTRRFNGPRLASGSQPVCRVDSMLEDRRLERQPWQRWRIKDGEKGPVVWECKQTFITVKDEDGLPGERLHLIIARNVLDPNEVKYFVSNAPPEVGVGTLLLVGFSRWRVERCFEDHKSEIGLDQYEGRRYLGLIRHLVLSSLSYLFLARTRQEWGEKSRADRLPDPHRSSRADPVLVA